MNFRPDRFLARRVSGQPLAQRCGHPFRTGHDDKYDNQQQGDVPILEEIYVREPLKSEAAAPAKPSTNDDRMFSSRLYAQAGTRRDRYDIRLLRYENVAWKEDSGDEAKTARTENQNQSRARAKGDQAKSTIGQISEAEYPERRSGKDAFVDLETSGNSPLRTQPALEERTVRRPAQYADQARAYTEGERRLGDAILSGLTGSAGASTAYIS
jgi:hypothetical protein